MPSLKLSFWWYGMCEMDWRTIQVCCFFSLKWFTGSTFKSCSLCRTSSQNMRFVTSHVPLRIRRICLHLHTSPKISSPVTTTATSSLLLMWSVPTHELCVIFIVAKTSRSFWFLCLFAFTSLSEFGIWNHPDTWPSLRGGLPAGPTGQEERPWIVHAAWELRQQAQQTSPQTSCQHPQICKHSCHTAGTTHSYLMRKSILK